MACFVDELKRRLKDIGNKILLFYLLFYVKEHEKVS